MDELNLCRKDSSIIKEKHINLFGRFSVYGLATIQRDSKYPIACTKIKTGPTGKRGPPQKVTGPVFSKLFRLDPSSETQGQIVGTRKSLNGRKNIWHEEK